MSTGAARESFAPIGSNLAGFDNYFCRGGGVGDGEESALTGRGLIADYQFCIASITPSRT